MGTQLWQVTKLKSTTQVRIFQPRFPCFFQVRNTNLTQMGQVVPELSSAWIWAASKIRQKPVLTERLLKSLNNECDFKRNQPYLSRGSNSLNSAWARLILLHKKRWFNHKLGTLGGLVRLVNDETIWLTWQTGRQTDRQRLLLFIYRDSFLYFADTCLTL